MTVTAPAAAPPSSSPSIPAPLVGFGEEVQDGKLAFLVRSVDSHVYTRERPYPQGMYLEVVLDARNIGNSSQTFSADYQKLIDNKGRQFSADTGAMDSTSARTDINPGNRAFVTLIFDVPKDTDPTQIVLHESVASPGVAVSLLGHQCSDMAGLFRALSC